MRTEGEIVGLRTKWLRQAAVAQNPLENAAILRKVAILDWVLGEKA